MTQATLNDIVHRGTPRKNTARVLSNRLFLWFCLAGTTLALLVLSGLMLSILLEGWSTLSWHFLDSFASRKPADSGIKGPLWGSVWVCILCAITALPLGIGTATYLEEFAPKNRVTGFINLNIMNLAGVPSIVYGIIGLTAFARMFGGFGSAADPSVLVGYAYYNEYESVDGEVLRAPVTTIVRGTTVETTGVQAALARWDVWIAHPAPAGPLIDGSMVEVLSTDEQGNEHWRGAVARIAEVKPTTQDTELAAQTVYVTAAAAATATAQSRDASWWSISLPFGSSVLAGGLTLMLVILPVVIISTQEALRAVPSSLRQGALALGSTRWQMVREMTLPAAIPGIMTGAILAMSRAIGEAAPILVLGGFLLVFAVPENLMSDFTVLPLQIYNWAGRPQASFHALAAAAIIVQLIVLLAFNGLAVFIRQKLQKDLQ